MRAVKCDQLSSDLWERLIKVAGFYGPHFKLQRVARVPFLKMQSVEVRVNDSRSKMIFNEAEIQLCALPVINSSYQTESWETWPSLNSSLMKQALLE